MCRVADAGGEVGEVVGEVFELGEFGEPFVRCGEVLDAEVDAGAEGVGVFGGDGVGTDEFNLFDEALLFGADEVSEPQTPAITSVPPKVRERTVS